MLYGGPPRARQNRATAGFYMLAGVEPSLSEFRSVRLSSGAEGYSLVLRALELAGENAEMQFAASLMQHGTVGAEHRRRAAAGAAKNSLLAKNLANIPQ